MIFRLFTQHPGSVGETYFEHMWQAFGFARDLALSSCIVFIHAVFPFVFETTASERVERLYRRMARYRDDKSDLPILNTHGELR